MTTEGLELSARLRRAAQNFETGSLALPALEELERIGIPAIVLKSLPQVEELYGDVAGRYTGDVDLVVRTHHSLRALEIIIDAGWKLQERRWFDLLASIHGAEEAASMRSWHLLREADDRVCTIDLHSDGIESWRHPVLDPTIWTRAQPRERDGVHFLILGPEDRLLFLCWHFFADAKGALGFPWHKLPDITLALQRDDIDWDYVGERARRLGISNFVNLACDLAIGRETESLLPLWRTKAAPAPYWRYVLLSKSVNSNPHEWSGRRRTVFWLMAHDNPLRTLPEWRHIVIPSRATIAANYLGYWPTVPVYLGKIDEIYWQRIAKTL